MARLLNESGERDDVRSAVEDNIYTFGWTGSEANYYARYEAPITKLSLHPHPSVSG